MLPALLTGKALHVFSTLSKADQRDYKKLRKVLMKGYDLTERVPTRNSVRLGFSLARCMPSLVST